MNKFIVSILALFLFACGSPDAIHDRLADQENRNCVPPPPIEGEQIMDWDFLSDVGDTVTYSLEQTEGTVNLVKLQDGYRWCAERFSGVTRVELKEVDVSQWCDADIRIGFKQGSGTWAYLGTISRHPQLECRPNQNVGWDEPGCRHIIHEIMHTIGYPHTQKHPWGFEVVEEEYLKDHPGADMDANFGKYDISAYNGFPYDSSSLMHYYFPPRYYSSPEFVPYTVDLNKQDSLMAEAVWGPRDCSFTVDKKIYAEKCSRENTKDGRVYLTIPKGATVEWNDGYQDGLREGMSAGNYEVTVTSRSCEVIEKITVMDSNRCEKLFCFTKVELDRYVKTSRKYGPIDKFESDLDSLNRILRELP